MLLELNEMIEDFSKALSNGKGAFFLGSGISIDSGLMQWSEMLSSYSPNIYNIAKGCPLPLVAQYMANESMGDPSILKEHVVQCVSKISNVENRFLNEIAKTKVTKIWTTNYDKLIEESFKGIDFNVKFGDSTTNTIIGKDVVEIIKMHGCITSTDDIVITQDDYDFFPKNYPNTCRKLLTDLCENTFLFIGYGFNDPNIQNIIRSSQWNNETHLGRHYLITKKNNEEIQKQTVWAKNLIRSGIYTFYVDDYDELHQILKKISLKSRGKRVYVTGAHNNTDSKIAESVGEELARYDDIILLDGQSQGIGQSVIRQYSSFALQLRKDLLGRIESFHNPYAVNPNFSDSKELIPLLKKHRVPLFRSAQLAIFFDGNLGTGVEFELAVENGCKILPIPTGEKYSHLMEKIVSHQSVMNYLHKFPEYEKKMLCKIIPTKEDIINCINLAIKDL